MESITIALVICKVIEIIGTISGGLVAAIFLKKLKENSMITTVVIQDV